MLDIVGEAEWMGYLHGRNCPGGAMLLKMVRYGGHDSGRRYYECEVCRFTLFFLLFHFLFVAAVNSWFSTD